MFTVDSSTSILSLFDGYGTTTATTASQTPVGSFYEVLPTELSSYIDRRINNKTIVMLVGLPASGKSTISKQLAQYLEANHLRARIYNAGNIRRSQHTFSNAEFFNPNNAEAREQREAFASITMHNLLADLHDNKINVGFLDATNTNHERRVRMMRMIQDSGVHVDNVVVLDVQCTDERLIDFNINGKAFNPDYEGKDRHASIRDFKQRAAHYYRVYEPITPAELQKLSTRVCLYAKITNGKHTQLTTLHKANDTTRLISDFLINYYDVQGKRYYEAVEAYTRNK